MAYKEPTLDDIPASSKRWIGKDVPRLEDPQLVTGSTEFIDNASVPGMLHCAMLHSTYAHAKIKSINTSEAEKLPGVIAILTGEDVHKWSNPAGGLPEGTGAYCMPLNKVSFVGEPIAAVAAESRYIAEDALDLIDVDYEPLQPVVDTLKAMEADSPLVIEELDTNIALQRTFTWGEVDEAFASADRVFTEKFRWNRMGANPIETFGCISQWDLVNNEVTIRGSIQSPLFTALAASTVLKLPSNKVRIISHARGGSFGGKGHPRGINISSMLSRKAGGRPVKWIEDRFEYLTSGASQAWDRFYEAEIALKNDGTVTGLRVKLVEDLGACGDNYGSLAVGKPLAAFTGCYTIPVASYDISIVLTNKLPISAYRGMGPPPHFFVLEQMMDIAARGLGMDTTEIRRKNYIQPEQFPYTIASGNVYDSGEYEKALNKVLDMGQYHELRKQQEAARKEGRYLGIGIANAIEPGVFDWNAYAIVGQPGVGIPESVTVSFDVFGHITARVGFTSEGQSQYTLIAQLLAEYFRRELSDINVIPLDTLSAPPAFGPGGSRLGVALAGAVMGAAKKLKQKMVTIAAQLLQSTPDSVELIDGELRVIGAPEVKMTVTEVVGVALGRSDLLPEGMEMGMEASSSWTAQDRNVADDEGRARSYLTAANACHLVLVEVDTETGETTILKYYIVDDCGTRLNPVAVEGMTQGGVAQGVAAALLEEYPYNSDGQPLASTFGDYLLPSIHEVPMTEKFAMVTPSPLSPLGAKGCGEGAIHTTPAAVLCAINDALTPFDVMCREVPASPRRVWELLNKSK